MKKIIISYIIEEKLWLARKLDALYKFKAPR